MTPTKTLCIAITLLCSVAASGQNDPAAKAILDKVSAKFKTLITVQANYNLNVTNRAGKNAGKKNGSIMLKGQKYKITDKSMEITSDGRKIWKFEPSANEVTISNVDNNAGGITPQKLFTNFYDKDFTYKLKGTAKVGTRTLSEIELTPVDKTKNFQKVLVYVDQVQQMIVSSKIFENSGNVYDYSISNLKTNAPLADNLFTFDKTKYAGVDEIIQ
ncbi:MAG: outer membrane lipoprotein carrier protein LolA [Bacteroidetes bacterium]|nr:MAG: outer membrane lipoprotein carrier protein LolA [Bacteroidota bacterium]